MKQTAVEFLLEKYKSQNTLLFSDDFEQAKEMEKEQGYSEEEVYNLLEEAMKDCYASELEHHHSGDYRNLKEWFEQFKND